MATSDSQIDPTISHIGFPAPDWQSDTSCVAWKVPHSLPAFCAVVIDFQNAEDILPRKNHRAYLVDDRYLDALYRPSSLAHPFGIVTPVLVR